MCVHIHIVILFFDSCLFQISIIKLCKHRTYIYIYSLLGDTYCCLLIKGPICETFCNVIVEYVSQIFIYIYISIYIHIYTYISLNSFVVTTTYIYVYEFHFC